METDLHPDPRSGYSNRIIGHPGPEGNRVPARRPGGLRAD